MQFTHFINILEVLQIIVCAIMSWSFKNITESRLQLLGIFSDFFRNVMILIFYFTFILLHIELIRTTNLHEIL